MAFATKCVPFLLLATLAFSNASDPAVGKDRSSARQQVKDIIAPIRRLQSEGPSMACMTACPTLVTAFMDMSSKAPSESENGSMDFNAMGTLLQSYCTHKDALTCLHANAASACSGMNNTDQMFSQMECFCSACPCGAHAYGTIMGTFMSAMSGGGGLDMASQMDTMCPVVEPFECMARSDACAAVTGQMSDMGSSLETLKPMCTAMNKPTRPAACEASGGGSMQTCGDVKKAYKAAGCCGNPTKSFTWPADQKRRLSSAAASEAELLESVKAALRKAELEGGKTKARRLSKMIDSIVESYTQNAV